MEARAAYNGSSRKLIVALDIGTTFSGAAYAFLDPGRVPQIQSVTRYLNTTNLGSAKVPSALYYDHDGNFCGIDNGVDFHDDDAFLRVKWWKLLISPTEPSAAMKDQLCKKLPNGKTIVDIFADFMGYLFKSTKALFRASEPNGDIRWNSVSNSIGLILTHPNDWGGRQQAQLRSAAVKAGIIPDTPAGHSSVHFVTEGEASFNFCATHTQAGKELKPGEQVLIIDAGGGTIDTSTYTVVNDKPLQVEELYEPECLLQGGEFVTARARAMIHEKLRGSKFNTPEDLDIFAQRFDEGVKRVFSSDQVTQHVKFGPPRDHDPEYGIKSGRLALTGKQVAEFFEPSIQTTVDFIRDNFSQRLATDSFAFLVGGFAASPWLSGQLEKELLHIGFKFCQPDTHTDKAVAVGAVSFYVDHLVTGRVSKFTYGIRFQTTYEPHNPEHTKREHTSFFDPAGQKVVPGCFANMLSRGTMVLGDREIRRSFLRRSSNTPPQRISLGILKYTGSTDAPQWIDVSKDNFETLCYVKADLSTAPYHMGPTTTGSTYYQRSADVILLVGLTELKAQISWADSQTGIERRNDAVVVYDNPSEKVG